MPPSSLPAPLPDLAEAFGGLKLEENGTFSTTSDRARKVEAVFSAGAASAN